MSDNTPRISHLLELLRRDPTDRRPFEELYPLVYDELHAIAAHLLRKERPGHTLQATALVNQVCLRLLERGSLSFKDNRHFFGVVSKAMGNLLVDHARQRAAQKRGGGLARGPMDSVSAPALALFDWEQIPKLEPLIAELGQQLPRCADVLRFRYWAGMTEAMIAEVLGVSVSTVKGDLKFGRAWLYSRLKEDGAHERKAARCTTESPDESA